ncbi:hypothetical protein [Shewanella glacialipiscicola]|uniref:hypothetical protein n=1 Tax=Shewanella glacialipiscicola TaxID=614069 RepID=UPI003D7BF374
MAKRFILRLRLLAEHHYAFKPSPYLKRFELPLNEQIFNTIGITQLIISTNKKSRQRLPLADFY